MQKNILLLIGLFLSGLCVAQKGDTLRKYLDENLSFTSKSNMTFPAMAIRSFDHWVLYSVYPDTNTLLRIYFKDRNLTIKDGPYDLYHPKRIKAINGTFLNNERHGTWVFYYNNGSPRDSGLVDHNRMTGTWYSWYENGQVMAIGSYPSPDKLPPSPPVIINKKNSLITSDTLINFRYGTWKAFYESGQLHDSGTYVNNQKHGEWKTWYKNGQHESIGRYEKNIMQGEWQYFRENGTRSTIEKYVNDKIVDLSCFDEEGRPAGISCSIMKPPVAQGRYLTFDDYVLDNIFWPENLPPNIVGVVKVKYTISKEGKLENFKIIKSPHPLLSKEVQRFFMAQTWSPAISHNRAVEADMNYEVPFFR